MTKPIPRSRLHITYRTKIDGTPKKARLPMRFLVLGDFTAHDRRSLGERKVHSIMPGMDLGSFMSELQLSARIDEPDLQQTLPGKFVGTITGKWKAKDEAKKKGTLKISGVGEVFGDIRDNGFGSFRGQVQVSGELTVDLDKNKNIDLNKLAGKVFKGGTVRIFGKVEPERDTFFGTTGLSGNIEVWAPNKGEYVPQPLAQVTVDEILDGMPEDDPELVLGPTVLSSDSVEVHLTIPLRKMGHFKPVHLAAMVPEIRRLVLLRNLALETRNYLANYPDLRDLIKQQLALDGAEKRKNDAYKPRLQELREGLKAKYPQLLVNPPRLEAEAPPVPPAEPES